MLLRVLCVFILDIATQDSSGLFDEILMWTLAKLETPGCQYNVTSIAGEKTHT